MELKKGFTTGSCAALASKAAVKMIFEKKTIKKESIVTPKGIKFETDILNPEINKFSASCAVKKYSGDDPDVTNGMLIFSSAALKKEKNIMIDGGEGIGRISKKGLRQNIGEAAINEVPKKMIISAVKEVFDYYGYEGGADIIISAPKGREIAEKTFNPRLGIEGGVSVLGTSGIVEPMSRQAVIDTIKVEMNVKKANDGSYVMIAPGNYGIDFIREAFNADLEKAVKCGNFVGESLDFAVELGFKGVLLIGHIGKFIKLAGGIMNTHSQNADSRMEILAANAALECGDIEVIRKIMRCITTDEAVEILKENDISDKVMKRITERAHFYVNNRVKGKTETGIVMFSNVYGILGKTENADKLFVHFKGGE